MCPIEASIEKILESYEKYGGINLSGKDNFPSRENVVSILQDIQSLIFPGFHKNEHLDAESLKYTTGERVHRIILQLTRETKKALEYMCKLNKCAGTTCFGLAEQTIIALIAEVPLLREKITKDTEAALAGDPAAGTIEEIILSYPGLEAIMVHRIAHFLYKNGVPLIPRIMSEYIHNKTGIDIHPGAQIDTGFFIDHGTGVVIGETCVIGKNVKIYQGVTLGALSVKKELGGKKRHPTIEDDVTIYPGATILGGSTVIGKGSILGGNVWVINSIPPGSKVKYRQVDTPE